MDSLPELATSEQVARRFGVTIGTVARWVREERIPCIRPSRRVVRFRLDDVEAAIQHPAAKEAEHGR